MLTYADVCWSILTYYDLCRTLTYADVWRMLTYDWRMIDVCWRMLTYCWRMLTYVDVWRRWILRERDRGRGDGVWLLLIPPHLSLSDSLCLSHFTIKLFWGNAWWLLSFWAWLSSPLMIRQRAEIQYQWFDYQVVWHYHLRISDSGIWKRLQNVYSQIKKNRLNPLSQPIWQPPTLHPVSYQPPTHRRLLEFPVCVFIIGEISFVITSRQFGFHSCLQCDFQRLFMVLFLRSSCCFPAEVKTRSIPPPDPGQPWNCTVYVECRTLTSQVVLCLVRFMHWQESPVTIWNMTQVR